MYYSATSSKFNLPNVPLQRVDLSIKNVPECFYFAQLLLQISLAALQAAGTGR